MSLSNMPSFHLAFLLTLLLCRAGVAQETRAVTVRFPHSRQIAERYHVLKSGSRVKYGMYTSYFPMDKPSYKRIQKQADLLSFYIRQQGEYIEGKKNGMWVEYEQPGLLLSKGNYTNGKKTGPWIQSREQGEVLEKYDYDTKQHQIPEIRIDIRYPEKARRAGIQGDVVLEYQLQSDCSLTNIRVLKQLNAECDQEAIRQLSKFYRYLSQYGPPGACEPQIKTWKVVFQLD